MFASTVPVPEIVLRATLLYLGLAVAHAMATDFLSIPEGLIFAATLLAWSVVLDAVAYRFPALGRVLKARPRPLIEDGRINQRALRREFLSREELDAQLRLQGVRDVSDVERAYLEPNGMVSVFTRDGGDDRPASEPSPTR
jgi:uncharacterized membrane protein YcaP (DUF421 family)